MESSAVSSSSLPPSMHQADQVTVASGKRIDILHPITTGPLHQTSRIGERNMNGSIDAPPPNPTATRHMISNSDDSVPDAPILGTRCHRSGQRSISSLHPLCNNKRLGQRNCRRIQPKRQPSHDVNEEHTNAAVSFEEPTATRHMTSTQKDTAAEVSFDWTNATRRSLNQIGPP